MLLPWIVQRGQTGAQVVQLGFTHAPGGERRLRSGCRSAASSFWKVRSNAYTAGDLAYVNAEFRHRLRLPETHPFKSALQTRKRIAFPSTLNLNDHCVTDRTTLGKLFAHLLQLRSGNKFGHLKTLCIKPSVLDSMVYRFPLAE